MKPKVNEYREVIGTLGDIEFKLRPPTNRDLIFIESLALEVTSNIEKQLRIFALLSELNYEVLLDLPGESTEVMTVALELFPVFRQKNK